MQLRERKESAEAEVRRKEEEIERLKGEVIKLDQTDKLRDEEIEKLKADVTRMLALSVELEHKHAEAQEQAKQTKRKYDELAQKVADAAEQRSIQQRVLEKAEARKKQRLSAVCSRKSDPAE